MAEIKTIYGLASAQAVLGEVATLFRECFQREFPLHTWEQFYLHNPYGEPIASLAYDQGRLVGHHAIVPQELTDTNGKIYPYWLSLSLMLHPAHRGIATFYELVSNTMTVALSSSKLFVLGFPNAHSSLPLQRFLHWRPILETGLFDWMPIPDSRVSESVAIADVDCVNQFSQLSYPYDAKYWAWRTECGNYRKQQIGRYLKMVYKQQGSILTILDLAVSNGKLARNELACFAQASGINDVRLVGVHADSLNIPWSQLMPHNDYTLRMCLLPIREQVHDLHFSLLLTDIF